MNPLLVFLRQFIDGIESLKNSNLECLSRKYQEISIELYKIVCVGNIKKYQLNYIRLLPFLVVLEFKLAMIAIF